jgi:hypothetical protein
MGFDHERLDGSVVGREFRLTEPVGNAVHEVFA